MGLAEPTETGRGMRHYQLNSLHERNGCLYLREEPFSGVAYEVVGDRVVANYLVSDGVRGGPAADWTVTRTRILYQAIVPITPDEIDDRHPEVGDYFEGTLFDGVSYLFDEDTGMLLEETDFDPDKGASRAWYSSGALREEFDRLRPDGIRESVTYDESGQVLSVKMRRMAWNLTPEFRLRTLRLVSGYPEGDLQRVPPQADSRLRLSSEGVTDQIIERLEGLPRLDYLNLDNTGITPAGLMRFAACSGLRELVTRANKGFGDEDVRALLTHYPNCKWDHRP